MPDGRTPREMEQPGYYNWAGRVATAGGSGSESSDSSFLDLAGSDSEDGGGAGPASMPPLFAVSSNPDSLYMRVVLPTGRAYRIQVDKTAKMIDIDPTSIAKNDRAGYGGNILISSLEWNRVKFEETVVFLPFGLTSIEAMAFSGWNMRSIIIQEGVTTIEPMAFFGCANLSSVKFPKTLRSIGAKAFGSCPSLSKVIIPLADGVAEDAFDGAFDASTMVDELLL